MEQDRYDDFYFNVDQITYANLHNKTTVEQDDI